MDLVTTVKVLYYRLRRQDVCILKPWVCAMKLFTVVFISTLNFNVANTILGVCYKLFMAVIIAVS